MDGAIYHNNPVQIADKERKLLWPGMAKEYPDLLVSLGSCYNPNSNVTRDDSPLPQSGFWSYGKSLLKIAYDHVMSALNSEEAWHAYMNVLSPPSNQRSKYFRLNPELDEEPPLLDQVEHMSIIKQKVNLIMCDNNVVQRLASHLIASSFYFQVTGVEREPLGGVMIKGKLDHDFIEQDALKLCPR